MSRRRRMGPVVLRTGPLPGLLNHANRANAPSLPYKHWSYAGGMAVTTQHAERQNTQQPGMHLIDQPCSASVAALRAAGAPSMLLPLAVGAGAPASEAGAAAGPAVRNCDMVLSMKVATEATRVYTPAGWAEQQRALEWQRLGRTAGQGR